MNEFIYDLPEHEYLSDRSRTSGSCLSMVARDPREYGRYLAGKREDNPSDAMRLGKYVHAVLLEGRSVVPERFAFAPSRAEYMVPKMVEQVGPRGGKKLAPCPTGAMVPQDPEQPNKLMELRTDEAKAYYRRFTQDHAGRTIIHPDQQPLAEAMIRAVKNHPEAAALLARPGFEPEVTAHWKDEQTGEDMRARFDGLRLANRLIVELKSVERLDPESGLVVMGWVRQGWPRKSGVYHDAFRAITGQNATIAWILVEATEESPRVCVVLDECDSPMAELGRKGNASYGLAGYRTLIRQAQAYRESRDFRAPWEREPLARFPLPFGLETALQFSE